ncbi:MAG: cellulose biosynthesis cyclic di-GMP-binding regulatory protein BcsB, partial [Aggregatilineales bacterium]
FPPYFEVRLNNQLIYEASFTTTQTTPQSIAVPLPLSAINTERARQTVALSIDARDHCFSNRQARLLIRSDLSYLHFEYERLKPTLSLALFPRPFYNNLPANQLETVFLVLADAFTPSDLENALSLAAGIGKLTGNQVRLRVTTPSALDPESRRENNLILLGKPAEHALLAQLYTENLLPTRYDAATNAFRVGETDIAPEEGIVQLIAHPENPHLAIMAFTGSTDRAIQKGVRAFAGRLDALGLEGSLAIVRDVRPLSQQRVGEALREVQTFADLGIETTTTFGVGSQFADFRFVVPNGVRISEAAYIELVFDYSDTLKEAQTSLNILLNEIPINSLNIGTGSDYAARLGPHRVRAPIPPSAVRTGEGNILTVQVESRGNWGCNLPNPATIWLNVRPESVLSLPRAAFDVALRPPLVSDFPVPFSEYSDLQDVLFILPDQPSLTEIEHALRLMARLGTLTENGERFAPRLALGAALPSGVDLAQYHIILYGRPSTNSLLRSINDKLAQPFAAGTDSLEQRLDDVILRLPPGFEIGVLQAQPSLWNPRRVLLTITGTSSAGETFAMLAMQAVTFFRGDLNGNIVYVTQNSVYAANTYRSQYAVDIEADIPTLVAETTLAANATPTPNRVFTVTPGPTETPTPTVTPSLTPTPSPIFSPTPLVPSPTPLPTFEPLPAEGLRVETPDPPAWIPILIALTAGVLLATGAFGLWSLVRAMRARRQE